MKEKEKYVNKIEKQNDKTAKLKRNVYINNENQTERQIRKKNWKKTKGKKKVKCYPYFGLFMI